MVLLSINVRLSGVWLIRGGRILLMV